MKNQHNEKNYISKTELITALNKTITTTKTDLNNIIIVSSTTIVTILGHTGKDYGRQIVISRFLSFIHK